ncbi:MAG: hemolysin family protein [Limisphaerales bacterium]|nr:HlyC/CorC family transporter [Verrucomicrobiota bacterium]
MEESGSIWILMQVGFVLLLVALNGFFVAAEFALVKIRESQIKPLIDEGNRKALMTRRVLEHLDASLSACQLGITLASLALGWVGEPVFAALLEPVMESMHIDSEGLKHSLSFLFGFSVITFLHITAGEQAPKLLAIQKPLPTSLWIAKPLWWFSKLSYPFIWGLNEASNKMLRWVGVEAVSEHELSHSEEELRMLIADTHRQQGGTLLEREIVFNAMELRQRLVREVMQPRPEIVFLSTDMTMEQCLEVMDRERYSRYPLCLDANPDQAIGVVHFKDVHVSRDRLLQAGDLKQISRKIIHLSETARLEKALQLFLRHKLHLGMVVDEYGTTVGMITLEDVLEELVGEIQDEFDQEVPMIITHQGGSFDVMGQCPLHDLSEILGTEVQEEGINTVSGWLTQQLGSFPKVGDEVLRHGFRWQVVKISGHLIERLRLEPVAEPTDD